MFCKKIAVCRFMVCDSRAIVMYEIGGAANSTVISLLFKFAVTSVSLLEILLV